MAQESTEGGHASASGTLRAILSQFALEPGLSIPTRAMLALMQTLDVSADAARQALSRAARRGAVARPPESVRGQVQLTADGRSALSMMADGLEPGRAEPTWDGTWSLVVVHAGASTAQPHRVRNELLLEGLGGLGNGVWITPHGDRSERLVALMKNNPSLRLMSGRATFDHPSNADIVEQAWDLTSLRAEWTRFGSDISALTAHTDEARFAAWISLVRHWLYVARLDPGIPREACGDRWPAAGVRELVDARRTSWLPGAQRYFRSLHPDSQPRS